jgi:NADH-ubiquinone oxidoreductase chain 4
MLCFDSYQMSYQTIYTLKFFNYYYYLGLDGISLLFILLTALIIPLCILFSWQNKGYGGSDIIYISCILAIEVILILVFLVMDILLFYIFFEAVLIPFFIMIGLRGKRKRRIHASYMLFFYTMFGSLIMLIAIYLLYLHTGTTNMQLLWGAEFSYLREFFLWCCFFISFAVKIPMFPFHIWLPEAHVESPTEASVILASVLLKIGLYGILRILIPIFYSLSEYMRPVVELLALLSIIYTSLTILRQIDIKRIIAYSSISHMNVCVLGIWTFDQLSLIGSVLLMFSHGLISGGLFFSAGILYDRYKTKYISYYSGLFLWMPIFATLLFFVILANISIPLSSNFIGELLLLYGIIIVNNVYIVAVVLFSILFSCIYSIWLYNRVCFGIQNRAFVSELTDINVYEFYVLIVLVSCIYYIGIHPSALVGYLNGALLMIII